MRRFVSFALVFIGVFVICSHKVHAQPQAAMPGAGLPAPMPTSSYPQQNAGPVNPNPQPYIGGYKDRVPAPPMMAPPPPRPLPTYRPVPLSMRTKLPVHVPFPRPIAQQQQQYAAQRYVTQPMMQVPAPKYSEMVPQPRFAQESMKWYLRGSFGYGEHENVDGGDQYESNNSVDGTLSAGAGFGYYFRPQIRGDITLDYFAQTKISTLGYDFESTIVMANLYYDIGMLNPNWKYIPYVGAGIGLAYNVLDDKEYDDDIDIAHSFMGGIGFYLEEGWWLDARYRYLNKGALGDGDDTQTDDIISNEIRLGFRYDIY